MNDLTVPPFGCGLQWSLGQTGFSCQISDELGFLGSVVAIVTVRALGTSWVLCWVAPRIFPLNFRDHPGRRASFSSSPDELWKLRPGQDEVLAQGHSRQVVEDGNPALSDATSCVCECWQLAGGGCGQCPKARSSEEGV